MATNRVVQARVPGKIYADAKRVIHASGLTVSDVVRGLMMCIAQDEAIPLALFQPNAETKAAFAEIERGEVKSLTLLLHFLLSFMLTIECLADPK